MILETSKGFFCTPPHSYENVNRNLTRNDTWFMRNIGNGGGHSLHFRNFKALVKLRDHL